MISVQEQLARVLAGVETLGVEQVTLADALGRTLAADVLSTIDIPVFDNSAMDGYAVRFADVAGASEDTPITLTVVADIPAGSAQDPALTPGTAARIMTGAPVPADADAIVQVEHTDGGTEQVEISIAPKPGMHIRRAAEDLHAGDRVLTVGAVLSPRHVSAAAAAGHPTLPVRARARVAVIATGSELVQPGSALTHGQIPESNSVLLAGLAAEAGADVVRISHVSDDDGALLAELDSIQAAGADLVILSGGVSVGAYDVTKAVLAPTGTVAFTAVAMQPGKPQAFGHLSSGIPVFGLPGNPVSACVSFEAFVRPALAKMHGRAQIVRPTLAAQVAHGWRTPPGRLQYMPVALEYAQVAAAESAATPEAPADATRPAAPGLQAGHGTTTVLRARPATSGGSGSHLVGGLAAADGFAIIPADVTEVREGDLVPVMLVNR